MGVTNALVVISFLGGFQKELLPFFPVGDAPVVGDDLPVDCDDLWDRLVSCWSEEKADEG